MATTKIQGPGNKTIGYLEDSGRNQKLFNANHHQIGTYYAQENKTFNERHQEVGKGNILLTLL